MRNKILILPLLFWAVLASAQNTGELPGVFSVAEGRQVQFSQGNLQYQPSTATWRFAEHQYDMIGATNAKPKRKPSIESLDTIPVPATVRPYKSWLQKSVLF